MERGPDFIRKQVEKATMQHKAFADALLRHEKRADDSRVRDLCADFIPRAQEHQRMLEAYRTELGVASTVAADGERPELADVAGASDFTRLVDVLDLSRQNEETFKIFREAGRALGVQPLARIGDMGERHHDEFNRTAGRLTQAMFIEQARDGNSGQSTEDGARLGD